MFLHRASWLPVSDPPQRCLLCVASVTVCDSVCQRTLQMRRDQSKLVLTISSTSTDGRPTCALLSRVAKAESCISGLQMIALQLDAWLQEMLQRSEPSQR